MFALAVFVTYEDCLWRNLMFENKLLNLNIHVLLEYIVANFGCRYIQHKLKMKVKTNVYLSVSAC